MRHADEERPDVCRVEVGAYPVEPLLRRDADQVRSVVVLLPVVEILGYLGPVTVQTIDLLIGRKRVASSGSGGRRHTQELLDFCGERGIVADVEVIPADQVSTAFVRLARNDVRYRFVLDLRGVDDGIGDVG